MVIQEIPETFKLKPLLEDGEILEWEHRGHESANSYAGKLILTVFVKDHPYWRREGLDLISHVDVGFATGILTQHINVKTIEGDCLVEIDQWTSCNKIVILKGKGLHSNETKNRGDHIIHLGLVSPKKLDTDSVSLYSQL